MPVGATHVTKEVSKSALRKENKNARRVEAAVMGDLTDCTYGKIVKTFGNRQFRIVNTKGTEHHAFIAPKMARVAIGDVVLLNIREYETRASSKTAVYDIMAVFDKKDINRLYKNGDIPQWMTVANSGVDVVKDTDGDDIFDCSEEDILEEDVEDNKVDKRNKVSKRKDVIVEDDDIDIDKI